jgi:hypothetical protein
VLRDMPPPVVGSFPKMPEKEPEEVLPSIVPKLPIEEIIEAAKEENKAAAPAPVSIPPSVVLMLEDESLSDSQKMLALKAVHRRLPPSVALMLDDNELSDTEKMALVKVLIGGAR